MQPRLRTDTARLSALDDHHLHAELRGSQGGNIPARAAPTMARSVFIASPFSLIPAPAVAGSDHEVQWFSKKIHE